jgi:hypothetical protein
MCCVLAYFFTWIYDKFRQSKTGQKDDDQVQKEAFEDQEDLKDVNLLDDVDTDCEFGR